MNKKRSDIILFSLAFILASAFLGVLGSNSANSQGTGPCIISAPQWSTTGPVYLGETITASVLVSGNCTGEWVIFSIKSNIGGTTYEIRKTVTQNDLPAGYATFNVSFSDSDFTTGQETSYQVYFVAGIEDFNRRGIMVAGTEVTSQGVTVIRSAKPSVIGGETKTYNWRLINPLAGKPTNVFGVIFLVSNWILNIAGALVVLLIIYAGVRFMISRGNPGEIQRARNILKWALAGFAVILIGKGFIFVIEAFLSNQIPKL